jgi:hypothetical protein
MIRCDVIEKVLLEVCRRTDADYLVTRGVDQFVAGAIAADWIDPRNMLEDLLDMLQDIKPSHYPSDAHDVEALPHDIWRHINRANPPLRSAPDFWEEFQKDIGAESGKQVQRVEEDGITDLL